MTYRAMPCPVGAPASWAGASSAPDAADWSRISTPIRSELDWRITALVLSRDTLAGCIGCGFLSPEKCAIWNPEDRAAALGPGPRHLLAAKELPIKAGESS